MDTDLACKLEILNKVLFSSSQLKDCLEEKPKVRLYIGLQCEQFQHFAGAFI